MSSDRKITPYLWMVAGCFCLAWMGQFAHLLRDTCDWRVIALVRAGLAFAIAIGLAKLCGARLVLWRPRALWLRGCASSLSLLCTFFAFSALPTAEVLTLTNTFPIWVAFLSWPLLQVRPTPGVWLAAGVGVLGVVLIQSPHLQVNGHALYAVFLALTAALTNAIAMLGLHRLKGLHPWAIVAHYSGVATVFVLGACILGGLPDFSPLVQSRTVLLLAAVGVAATLGQVCVTQAFTHGQPARVSVIALSQVVFALGLDAVVAGVELIPITLGGIALVLAPSAWMIVGGAKRPSPVIAPTMGRPSNDSVGEPIAYPGHSCNEPQLR
jgi:drug/metabolite transporter (DMT)-like permease